MRKTEIVRKIDAYLRKHKLNHDTRIYFNDKAWAYNSNGEKSVLEEVKGSDYFQYANDDTISMSFEGGLFNVLNAYRNDWVVLQDEFVKLFDEYDCWYELGNAWNLSVYEDI